MNRRRFLKFLGAGTAAVAVAPTALAAMAPPLSGNGIYCDLSDYGKSYPWSHGQPVPPRAKIGEYADYANFSDFAVKQAIDESVLKAAKELGRAHAERINRLVASAQLR